MSDIGGALQDLRKLEYLKTVQYKQTDFKRLLFCILLEVASSSIMVFYVRF